MLAIAVLPAAFTYTYGVMVGRRRHGWVLYGVYGVCGLLVCGWSQQHGNPLLSHAIDIRCSATQAGGNMEGKEVRFGIIFIRSLLHRVTTSNGATGSYNRR